MANNANHDNEDFLAELIAERSQQNPNFPQLVEAAIKRRREARERAAENGSAGSDAPSTEAGDQADEANSIAPARSRE